MSTPAMLNAAPSDNAGSPDYQGTAARVRELVTPEGVDLRLTLADASERASAFLLDLSV